MGKQYFIQNFLLKNQCNKTFATSTNKFCEMSFIQILLLDIYYLYYLSHFDIFVIVLVIEILKEA